MKLDEKISRTAAKGLRRSVAGEKNKLHDVDLKGLVDPKLTKRNYMELVQLHDQTGIRQIIFNKSGTSYDFV